MKELIINSISKSITYKNYLELIKELTNNQKTTGKEQSIERINFTKLNYSRMRRLDKTIWLLDNDIKTFNNLPRQTWLVLTESWCGDAAQTLPILNKIAESSSKIDLRIVQRDENIDLMNNFLSNSAQAIPKLIILNNDYYVINTWGPRSDAATKLVMDYKKKHGKIDASFKKELQIWYNKNKGKSIINDLLKLDKNINQSLVSHT